MPSNELLGVSGIAEELTVLLRSRVDVVAASLLRGGVSAILRCQDYAPQLGSDDLASMACDALLRNLDAIGEAVRSLPSETRAAMPGVPWASIAGLRNIVVQKHFRVNPELILDIVDHELVDLARAIRNR